MLTAPTLAGWKHIGSGKVRELYVNESNEEEILVVSSDRISAYDFVLDTAIPDKGKVLTALSLWWFQRIEDAGLGVKHHVISTDVPAEVAGRAMICRKLDMIDVECVARGYIEGSGWREYQAAGNVCGVSLPEGLVQGSALPNSIFTPAIKAQFGQHDENVSFDEIVYIHGKELSEALRETTLRVYDWAAEVAKERGILLADTKFEFGLPLNHEGAEEDALVIADEVLTPDSSRYWPADEYQPGGAQVSFDKQFVRDWLTSPDAEWDRTGSTPPPPLPQIVAEKTRERYVAAYERLTGLSFDA